MRLENLISENYELFTEGEKFIAHYILNNKNKIPLLGINDLAENCLSSKSSILRFCQKIGFHGYAEFKGFVRGELSTVQKTMPKKEIKEIFTSGYIKLLNYYIDINLESILENIFKTEKIYVLGTGRQQQIWLHSLQRTFLEFNKKIELLEYGMDNALYKATINELTENDLLIVHSHSGENKTLKRALNLALLKKVKIISFTTRGDNWLSSNSDYNISVRPDYIFEDYAPNATHMLIDILAFKYEDYLKNV